MIPFITMPLGTISTFSIFAIIGILSLFLTLHLLLKHSPCRKAEELFIFTKIIISGSVGLFCAGLFNSVFHYIENGIFSFSGITFYGGLIGAMICMFFLLKFSKEKSYYSATAWFEILTLPFVSFHFFGRIGCFMGGCCYGKVTQSIFGIVFPDNQSYNIIHNGVKRLPTQLFEATILLLIFVILLLSKKKFKRYLFLYAVSRFFIEFLRDDIRGSVGMNISPAQLISLVIIFSILIKFILKKRFNK